MVPACSNSVLMVAGDDEDEEEHKKRVKSLKKDEAGNKRPCNIGHLHPMAQIQQALR